MNELSKALNEIILDLDTLSDQELQAKFEASKGGLVGAAILDSEMFHPKKCLVSIEKPQ